MEEFTILKTAKSFLTFASIKNRHSILDCNLMYEIVPVRTHKLILMPTYFSGGVGEVIKIGRNIR
jgi:hypothetical protein